MRYVYSIISVGVFCVALAASDAARAQSCSFPHGENTTVDELVKAVLAEPACGLPWPALKRIAADPHNVAKLHAAYETAERSRPERVQLARELSLQVDAAAGHPEQMLALYDRNIAAHPEDKSLPNAACWIRANTGIDLEHALPFCDRAVATGRPAYALVNRAVANLLLNHNRNALNDFNEALSQANFRQHWFYPKALYGRGQARLRLADGKGEADIQQAMHLDEGVAADFAAAGFKRR